MWVEVPFVPTTARQKLFFDLVPNCEYRVRLNAKVFELKRLASVTKSAVASLEVQLPLCHAEDAHETLPLSIAAAVQITDS